MAEPLTVKLDWPGHLFADPGIPVHSDGRRIGTVLAIEQVYGNERRTELTVEIDDEFVIGIIDRATDYNFTLATPDQYDGTIEFRLNLLLPSPQQWVHVNISKEEDSE